MAFIGKKTSHPFSNHKAYSSVIHIGAHLCEEISEYDFIARERIIWVEADPNLYNRATAILTNLSNKNHVIHNYFVTDICEPEIELNIYNNDGASNSIYQPGKKMDKYWPDLGIQGKVKVKTLTLEKIVEMSQLKDDNNLLVLDVQGHELSVLMSGLDILKNFKTIICELSYKEIYKDAPLAGKIIELLQRHNFKLLNPKASFHYDGIFARNKID